MGYIGNVPAEKYSALTQQTFSSPTGTSFTLDQSCTNSKDIALFIDNLKLLFFSSFFFFQAEDGIRYQVQV